MTMKAAALALLIVAAFAPGCSNSATAPSTVDSPKTDSYSGTVALRGSSSHGFNIGLAGTISVTLTSFNPPGTVVGLGIGIPTSTGLGCTLSRTVTAAAGSSPQLQASVDAGAYCVVIYDVGNLADVGAFAISIVHP